MKINKKFIYDLKQRLNYPLLKLKTVHELLKQKKESEIEDVDRNYYQVFADWILDVFVYGFLISVSFSAIAGWSFGTFLLRIFPLGIMWWLWFEFLRETVKCLGKK